MKLPSPTSQILESIENNFSNQYKKIRENIALVAYSIIRGQKVMTREIARHMNEVNGLNFKANDMKVYRLLSSPNFQVDDRLLRGYIRLFFKMIKKSGFDKKEAFFINVDYTTDTDDFLILCASMRFQGQSIPLYFSLRKYPKRAGMHDQKKLEEAFFRALRHLLPKRYQYTIVADRGFGNDRVINLLEELDFKYILRLNANLKFKRTEEQVETNINELPHKNYYIYQAVIVKWSRKITLVKRVQKEDSWILATNHSEESASKIGQNYEGRFSIEKLFKNKKSGGFDLETLKIEKYDRFKRLLFISCIAYSIMIFTGIKANNSSHSLKKKWFPTPKKTVKKTVKKTFSIFTLIRKIINHFNQKALQFIQRILQLE
jgi:hypothetical protein